MVRLLWHTILGISLVLKTCFCTSTFISTTCLSAFGTDTESIFSLTQQTTGREPEVVLLGEPSSELDPKLHEEAK